MAEEYHARDELIRQPCRGEISAAGFYMYFANAGNIEWLRPLWNLHQPSAVHLRRRMRLVKTASSQLSPLAGFCASGIFSLNRQFECIPTKTKPAAVARSGSGCRKNPRRAREGRSPLELSIEPSGVYGGRGAILSQGNPISRRENSYLADFAAGVSKELKQNLEGVVVAGELAPPSTSLSKRLF